MSRVIGPFSLCMDVVGGGGSLLWYDSVKGREVRVSLHFPDFKDAATAASVLSDFVDREVAKRVEAELPPKKQGGAP